MFRQSRYWCRMILLAVSAFVQNAIDREDLASSEYGVKIRYGDSFDPLRMCSFIGFRKDLIRGFV